MAEIIFDFESPTENDQLRWHLARDLEAESCHDGKFIQQKKKKDHHFADNVKNFTNMINTTLR